LVAEGEDPCLDAVLQAEVGEDAADVGLDGLLADGQVPGDLPVAVTAAISWSTSRSRGESGCSGSGGGQVRADAGQGDSTLAGYVSPP
jgi:hypothetical protein